MKALNKINIYPLFFAVFLLFTGSVYADSQSYTLTNEQRIKIEESWRKVIVNHANILSSGFDRSMPGDYIQFGQFRVNDWNPAFTKDRDRVASLFPTLAQRNTPDFEKIRNLNNAFTRLDVIAMSMMTALKTQKRSDLEQVRTHMYDFSKLVKE